jgi:hypothetical protein
MPTPFDVMDAERKKALEKVEEVEQDMRDLERIVSKYKLLVVPAPGSFDTTPIEPVLRSTFERVKTEGETIIRTSGYPLQTIDLFMKLVDKGVVIGGRDPMQGMSACLARNHNIQYLGKIGWWLKGVSWPPKPAEIGLISEPAASAPAEEGKRRRRSQEKEAIYQALRKFLEGKAEPTPFPEIYDHIESLGLPLGGANKRQNLSAFMTSIHEFHSHGPTGRLGWTFVADGSWSVVKGFNSDANFPLWRRGALKLNLYEATRKILEGQPQRVKFNVLFAQVKERVQFGKVQGEDRYFRNFLTQAPCFEKEGHKGWRYVPELDTPPAAAEKIANDFENPEYTARRRAGLFTRTLDFDDDEPKAKEGG